MRTFLLHEPTCAVDLNPMAGLQELGFGEGVLPRVVDDEVVGDGFGRELTLA